MDLHQWAATEYKEGRLGTELAEDQVPDLSLRPLRRTLETYPTLARQQAAKGAAGGGGAEGRAFLEAVESEYASRKARPSAPPPPAGPLAACCRASVG